VTVTLSGPGPTGGAQIFITSDNGGIVPGSFTIPAGQTSGNFTAQANTGFVQTTTTTVTASYNSSSKSVSVTVTVPTATTQAASGVSQTGFQMNGIINPNGTSTGTFFEWGTSASLSTSTATAGSGFSGTSNISVNWPLSGLSCGTTYYYRVVAAISGGASVRGNIVSATTAQCSSPL
jgi:phosphodiesterase/alkaline phosphatase D-like protein